MFADAAEEQLLSSRDAAAPIRTERRSSPPHLLLPPRRSVASSSRVVPSSSACANAVSSSGTPAPSGAVADESTSSLFSPVAGASSSSPISASPLANGAAGEENKLSTGGRPRRGPRREEEVHDRSTTAATTGSGTSATTAETGAATAAARTSNSRSSSSSSSSSKAGPKAKLLAPKEFQERLRMLAREGRQVSDATIEARQRLAERQEKAQKIVSSWLMHPLEKDWKPLKQTAIEKAAWISAAERYRGDPLMKLDGKPIRQMPPAAELQQAAAAAVAAARADAEQAAAGEGGASGFESKTIELTPIETLGYLRGGRDFAVRLRRIIGDEERRRTAAAAAAADVDDSFLEEPTPAGDTLVSPPLTQEESPLERLLLEKRAEGDLYWTEGWRRGLPPETREERGTQYLTAKLLKERAPIKIPRYSGSLGSLPSNEELFEELGYGPTADPNIPLPYFKRRKGEEIYALLRVKKQAHITAAKLGETLPFADFTWSRQPSFDPSNVDELFRLGDRDQLRQFEVTEDVAASHQRVRLAARCVADLVGTPRTDEVSKFWKLKDILSVYSETPHSPEKPREQQQLQPRTKGERAREREDHAQRYPLPKAGPPHRQQEKAQEPDKQRQKPEQQGLRADKGEKVEEKEAEAEVQRQRGEKALGQLLRPIQQISLKRLLKKRESSTRSKAGEELKKKSGVAGLPPTPEKTLAEHMRAWSKAAPKVGTLHPAVLSRSPSLVPGRGTEATSTGAAERAQAAAAVYAAAKRHGFTEDAAADTDFQGTAAQGDADADAADARAAAIRAVPPGDSPASRTPSPAAVSPATATAPADVAYGNLAAHTSSPPAAPSPLAKALDAFIAAGKSEGKQEMYVDPVKRSLSPLAVATAASRSPSSVSPGRVPQEDTAPAAQLDSAAAPGTPEASGSGAAAPAAASSTVQRPAASSEKTEEPEEEQPCSQGIPSTHCWRLSRCCKSRHRLKNTETGAAETTSAAEGSGAPGFLSSESSTAFRTSKQRLAAAAAAAACPPLCCRGAAVATQPAAASLPRMASRSTSAEPTRPAARAGPRSLSEAAEAAADADRTPAAGTTTGLLENNPEEARQASITRSAAAGALSTGGKVSTKDNLHDFLFGCERIQILALPSTEGPTATKTAAASLTCAGAAPAAEAAPVVSATFRSTESHGSLPRVFASARRAARVPAGAVATEETAATIKTADEEVSCSFYRCAVAATTGTIECVSATREAADTAATELVLSAELPTFRKRALHSSSPITTPALWTASGGTTAGAAVSTSGRTKASTTVAVRGPGTAAPPAAAIPKIYVHASEPSSGEKAGSHACPNAEETGVEAEEEKREEGQREETGGSGNDEETEEPRREHTASEQEEERDEALPNNAAAQYNVVALSTRSPARSPDSPASTAAAAAPQAAPFRSKPWVRAHLASKVGWQAKLAAGSVRSSLVLPIAVDGLAAETAQAGPSEFSGEYAASAVASPPVASSARSALSAATSLLPASTGLATSTASPAAAAFAAAHAVASPGVGSAAAPYRKSTPTDRSATAGAATGPGMPGHVAPRQPEEMTLEEAEAAAHLGLLRSRAPPPAADAPALPFCGSRKSIALTRIKLSCAGYSLSAAEEEEDISRLHLLRQLLQDLSLHLGPSWRRTLPATSLLAKILEAPCPRALRKVLLRSGQELLPRLHEGVFWAELLQCIWVPLLLQRVTLFSPLLEQQLLPLPCLWDPDEQTLNNWSYFAAVLPRMHRLSNYLLTGLLETRVPGVHRLLFRLNALLYFAYRIDSSLFFGSDSTGKPHLLTLREEIRFLRRGSYTPKDKSGSGKPQQSSTTSRSVTDGPDSDSSSHLRDSTSYNRMSWAAVARKQLGISLQSRITCRALCYNFNAISLLWPFVMEIKSTSSSRTKEELCSRLFAAPFTHGFFLMLANHEVPDSPAAVSCVGSFLKLLTNILYGARSGTLLTELIRDGCAADSTLSLWQQLGEALQQQPSARPSRPPQQKPRELNVFLVTEILLFLIDLLLLSCLDGAPLPRRAANELLHTLNTYVLNALVVKRPTLCNQETWGEATAIAASLRDALQATLDGEPIPVNYLKAFACRGRLVRRQDFSFRWPSTAELRPLPCHLPCWRPGCGADLFLTEENAATCSTARTRYCEGCYVASYCSSYCQALHWTEGHALRCKLLSCPPTCLRFYPELMKGENIAPACFPESLLLAEVFRDLIPFDAPDRDAFQPIF